MGFGGSTVTEIDEGEKSEVHRIGWLRRDMAPADTHAVGA